MVSTLLLALLVLCAYTFENHVRFFSYKIEKEGKEWKENNIGDERGGMGRENGNKAWK